MTMIGNNPWPFGRSSCLGSKFVAACEAMGQTALPRTWGTGEVSSPKQPCQAEFPHDYERNRPIPLGKWVPIPANTETAPEYPAGDRGWAKQADAIVVGGGPVTITVGPDRRGGQLLAVAWQSSRLLLGSARSESNRKRSSVIQGTREALPCRAVARIGRLRTVESRLMKRQGGGAPVVVRGRESRPHGEGVQDVSCWADETFGNREGSR
jgi:hypothetical protein